MTERSDDNLHRRIVNKVAYAFMMPLALFISSTITLIRTHGQPAAWCVWIAFAAAAVILRVVIMQSVRRDLAKLRNRNHQP